MTAAISIVVARAANGVIGQHGQLPWRIPADMKHFKTVTMGKPCIMGRKTWESLTKRPLPGRANIVLTRENAFAAEGAHVAHTLEDALRHAEAGSPAEIAIIGGAGVYRAVLPRACRIHLTDVHSDFEGDVFMPPFDPAEWKEVSREDHAACKNTPAFSFITLERH